MSGLRLALEASLAREPAPDRSRQGGEPVLVRASYAGICPVHGVRVPLWGFDPKISPFPRCPECGEQLTVYVATPRKDPKAP